MKYKKLVVTIILVTVTTAIAFLLWKYCRVLYTGTISACGGFYVGRQIAKLIDWIFSKETNDKEETE